MQYLSMAPAYAVSSNSIKTRIISRRFALSAHYRSGRRSSQNSYL